jgi:hypothetical protein
MAALRHVQRTWCSSRAIDAHDAQQRANMRHVLWVSMCAAALHRDLPRPAQVSFLTNGSVENIAQPLMASAGVLPLLREEGMMDISMPQVGTASTL